MAKMNISTALAATLVALLTPVVEGQGKLWDNTRDAYKAALIDFPKPEDAAAAIRQVVTVTLKANAGSVKGYLSTLNWLVNNGHKDKVDAGIKMGEADALRYPKPLKPGQEGYMEQQAAKDKAAKDAKEQAEREEAEAIAADPRRALLHQLGKIVGPLDFDTLSLVVAEVGSIVEALATKEAPEAEAEQAEAQTA